MATYDGRKSAVVRDGLRDHPAQFNFYQAVRLLSQSDDADLPELDRIDRALDFCTESGDQFHANDISQVAFDTTRPKMTVATFGLSGPLGPLPQQHSEWVYAEARAGRTELKAFLSLFEHRFISLLYLIKQRFHAGLHKGPRSSSNLYRYLKTVSGLPLGSNRVGDTEARFAPLLPFAGLLAGGRASAASVDQILSTLLRAPVKIRSMQGAFVPLDKAYHARLAMAPGSSESGLEMNLKPQRLGDKVALGKRVWDQQNAIEIEIGPVDYATAESWMPGEADYDRLVELLRYTTNGQWVLHTIIDVREPSIPESKFSNGPRLGLNSWLKTAGGVQEDTLKTTRRTINPTPLH